MIYDMRMEEDEEEEEAALSADDLKKQLFLSLRSSGILTSLKTQLRASLFHHLKDSHPTLIPPRQKNYQKPSSLEDRIRNSLFFHYLEAHGYPFTQSVFVSEGGIETAALFSHKELMQILHLNDNGAEGLNKEDCLLNRLLTAVQGLSVKASTRDSSTQTSGLGNRESIVTCLREVEDKYQKMIEEVRKNPSKTLEERAFTLQKEFDEKVRREVEEQVKRIREFELDAVRVEEGSHYRRQLAKARLEFEDLHKNRLEQLHKSESSFMKVLKAKEKELEIESFKHRQQILEAMQNLKEREEKLKSCGSNLQEKTALPTAYILHEKEISLKLKDDKISLMREFLHKQAQEVLASRKKESEIQYKSIRAPASDPAVLESEKESFEQERHIMQILELESATSCKDALR